MGGWGTESSNHVVQLDLETLTATRLVDFPYTMYVGGIFKKGNDYFTIAGYDTVNNPYSIIKIVPLYE